MNPMIRTLVEKISKTNSLKAAHAYADTLMLILDTESLVTPVLNGANEQKLIINAIKVVRGRFDWGLKESKDFIEKVPNTFPRMSVEAAVQLKNELAACGYKVVF